MKNLWKIMVAALVIIGATACTENYDGIEKAEGFSFFAEIANDTRAYIADEDGDKTWETKWQLGDKLYVNGYEFVCTDVETGKFTCYNDEVAALVGQPVTITTDGNHSSYDGYEALYTTAEVESFGANAKIQLQALTSFLRFSVAGPADVKFTLTSDAFRDQDGNNVGEVTLMDKSGENFVAFWPGESLTATLTCYVGGVQCKSKELTFTAGKVYNLGDVSPVYKVYVLPQPKSSISKWTKFNLYTWVEAGVANTWPGDEITSNTEVVNGYTYYVYQYPSDFNGKTVNAIVNNKVGDSGDQTADIKLGVLNTDYYLVVNSLSEVKVSTTAPAAGSVEEAKVVEDPKPQTVSLYLKTTWGWSSWALYAWGGSGTWGAFSSWPGKAMYTATIDGVSYKAWDIPDSCVGQTGTQIIVTGKENNQTKQSVDFPVTFKSGEDVFIEISSWNGNLNKCELKLIASPYTE